MATPSADRETVAAVHAFLLVDNQPLYVGVRILAYGARRAGGHGGGYLADGADPGVIYLGRLGVYAHDGDIGAVHGAAHIDAAGQRYPQLGRQLHAGEIWV
jgi:hypothetical protein